MTDKYATPQVHTDALATLGTIITESEKRDAIHLAVYPVESADYFIPSMDCKLDDDGKAARASGAEDGVGIVDPFLREQVKPGEWFWLVVYPRQITSLRHVWEHKSFPVSGETEQPVVHDEILALAEFQASELWLRKFIAENDLPPFDVVVAAATGVPVPTDPEDVQYYGTNVWTHNGDYIIFHGVDAHCQVDETFWFHMQQYTGQKIENKVDYFGCSC